MLESDIKAVGILRRSLSILQTIKLSHSTQQSDNIPSNLLFKEMIISAFSSNLTYLTYVKYQVDW